MKLTSIVSQSGPLFLYSSALLEGRKYPHQTEPLWEQVRMSLPSTVHCLQQDNPDDKDNECRLEQTDKLWFVPLGIEFRISAIHWAPCGRKSQHPKSNPIFANKYHHGGDLNLTEILSGTLKQAYDHWRFCLGRDRNLTHLVVHDHSELCSKTGSATKAYQYHINCASMLLSLYYGLGVVVALISNQYTSVYQRACACFFLLSFRTFSLSGESSAVTQLSLGLCCSRTRSQVNFQRFIYLWIVWIIAGQQYIRPLTWVSAITICAISSLTQESPNGHTPIASSIR